DDASAAELEGGLVVHDVPAGDQRAVQLERARARVDRDAVELEALVLVLIRDVEDARPVRADLEVRLDVATRDERSVETHGARTAFDRHAEEFVDVGFSLREEDDAPAVAADHGA